MLFLNYSASFILLIINEWMTFDFAFTCKVCDKFDCTLYKEFSICPGMWIRLISIFVNYVKNKI